MAARLLALGIATFAVAFDAAAQTRSMVVHLPEAPIESMAQLGDGVTQLSSYLESASPGLRLTVKAFRKSEDALRYIAAEGDDVALVVSDTAFLLDLPPGFDATPAFRFVRGGGETRRKLVVVKKASGLSSLADLRGKSLTVAQSATSGSMTHLTRAVFGEEIDPSVWFARIEHASDDFTATAAVVYGNTEAALVSEDNPLLVSHLGKELTEVYASGPVSMAVVSFRRSALSSEQTRALESALQRAATDAAAVLAELKCDGFRPVSESALLADVQTATAAERALEIVVPTLYLVGSDSLPPPDPGTVPFLVGFELPDVPIDAELIDAVMEPKKP